jgi:hypothetical protein
MTMPKTAAFMKLLPAGTLPEEMTDAELSEALHALRLDLPGDPLGYIEQVAPTSEQCECGAIHLQADAENLREATAKSLHRLLATPYGDIVREHHRRKNGYQNIRFGWQGIESRVPSFIATIEKHDVRTKFVSEISDEALFDIVEALRTDMPNVMQMIDGSIAVSPAYSVSPAPDDESNQQWKHLIDQVMFAWSTPVRKYLGEWLSREHGVYGGAVNCCIVMTATRGESESQWRRRWMNEQTSQQLTPDC